MAKATTVEETENTRTSAFDQSFIDEVVELREEQELKWAEIAEQLGCVGGKAMLAYMVHTMPPKDKIKGKTDEELGPKIVAARDDDGDSWGRISARAGIPESKVRKLYTDTSGTAHRGLRIGKGGRYPGDEVPAAVTKAKAAAAKEASARQAERAKASAAKKAAAATKKAAAPKKSAAKKAPATRKPAAPKGNPLLKLDLEGLKNRLDGKTISVDRDGSKSKIKVKTINGNADGNIEFTDSAGKSRTIEIVQITSASR